MRLQQIAEMIVMHANIGIIFLEPIFRFKTTFCNVLVKLLSRKVRKIRMRYYNTENNVFAHLCRT